MSYRHTDSVDLLEIYHARQLRVRLLDNLRRLAQDEEHGLGLEPDRRGEVLEHYAALLAGTEALLRCLGDVPTPHIPR
jgi:hypothetical protein